MISLVPHSTDTFINIHKKNKSEKVFQMSFITALEDIQLREITSNFGLVMTLIYMLYILLHSKLLE